MKGTLLIVEDDPALREALCDTLELAGYTPHAVADGEAALALFRRERIDLVISDIQMAGMDGHALLVRLKQIRSDTPVLLMSAYGSIPSAVRAMQDGAADYLVKPFEAEVLVSKVAQLLPTPSAGESGFITHDPGMLQILELAARVADTDATVLITGESGTGKEVLFRLIHARSRRAALPAVAINCAAIPENMLEAILFGYEKGAFTGAYKASPGKFEQAQGGTLLLDEISEMSLALQAKLLRVLQEREVERLGGNRVLSLDVRVIATSNRDLKESVRLGRFREDLLYRLNVFPIRIPALRNRPLDILPLAHCLLERAARYNAAPLPRLNASAQARLAAYSWPGNVRELDNVMQRARIIHEGEEITEADLQFEPDCDLDRREAVNTGIVDEPQPDQLGRDLRTRERHLILEALEEGGGSRKFAAVKLGISPRTLRYKIAQMKQHGVEVP